VSDLKKKFDAAAAAEETAWTADTSQVLTDSLQLFLQDVGKHKLLTAAEEVALAKRVERGDAGREELAVYARMLKEFEDLKRGRLERRASL